MRKTIPPGARRVFQGQIFDVYQWDQLMPDESTQVFEMLKRPDTVITIPIVDGKLLSQYEIQPTQSHITFPGGRVDAGEDLLVAAKRELLEEQGYASDDWEHYMSYQPQEKIDWEVHIYIAHDAQRVDNPRRELGEQIEAKLISFEEFVMLVKQGGLRGSAGGFQADILRMLIIDPALSAFRKRLGL